MVDYVMFVRDPSLEPSGWWFVVRTTGEERHGPFATECDARAAREGLFHRWNRAARAKRGWMWKATHERWHLTVPAQVQVRMARMENTPVSVHAAELAS